MFNDTHFLSGYTFTAVCVQHNVEVYLIFQKNNTRQEEQLNDEGGEINQ